MLKSNLMENWFYFQFLHLRLDPFIHIIHWLAQFSLVSAVLLRCSCNTRAGGQVKLLRQVELLTRGPGHCCSVLRNCVVAVLLTRGGSVNGQLITWSLWWSLLWWGSALVLVVTSGQVQWAVLSMPRVRHLGLVSSSGAVVSFQSCLCACFVPFLVMSLELYLTLFFL